jgi:predicted glutamine amidotransferase
MCGIAGFIGESTKPIITYQLITRLFEKTETRGVDAAGFWGAQPGVHGKIIFHKEPIKSSALVKKDIWKKLARLNPNLLIVHARQASQGVGEPANNKNNHPFVNEDRTIALIHNGRITNEEYTALKNKYEVYSDCDSEILLRIFEGAERKAADEFGDEFEDISVRLSGLKDIFSYINHGHMAVAIGEQHNNGGRSLWLFRNAHRSLWTVDMRESLGQIFFCSTPEIWQDAVRCCPGLESHIGKSQKLIEVPTEEVWYFHTDVYTPHARTVQRFSVARGEYRPWVYDGNKLNIPRKDIKNEVICRLDNNDIVRTPPARPIDPGIDVKKITQRVERIKQQIENVQIQSDLVVNEGSLTLADYEDLLQALEMTDRDLEGILKTIGG